MKSVLVFCGSFFIVHRKVGTVSMKNNTKRNAIIKQLSGKDLDVLIIGGGITGAGISLDATKRGMNVGLIDMQDFAAGTSSRSTKLVHGGLRYLKQFEVGLVAEVGKEREIVYENAPHVTKPEWMMLPFYKGGTFGPLSTNVGLRVYDFLAGVKRKERRKMFTPKEALKKEPLLQSENLKGAGYYVEYKTDDARLTLEVMKKSVELGTKALNYAKVTSLLYDEQGKIIGAEVHDLITNVTFPIYAKKVINATGPWVDEIREMDQSKEGKTLQITKGVHLVFDQSVFPLQQAIYFDTHDKRMIFAIPRDGKTYVGTTDTMYQEDLIHPDVTKEDQAYLLEAINWMFPTLSLSQEQVESSWSGVRPLISDGDHKKPSEISRKDEVFLSQSGLYSMAGGKLTGYRKMAEDVINRIANDFKKEEGIIFGPSETKYLKLSGGEVENSQAFFIYRDSQIKKGIELGLTEEEASHLVNLYGTNVKKVFQYIQDDIKVNMPKEIYAMLRYGLEEEFVQKPIDFFIRRTGALFFNINWVLAHEESVLRYMEDYFKWSKEEFEQYKQELDDAVYKAQLKDIS